MSLRTLLMTADAVGGVWTYALSLAQGLSARGVAVTLAAMGASPSAGQRAAASAVANLSLLEAPWKLEWEEGCEGDLRASAEWLLAIERRLRPDLVHVNGFWHASLPWRAPRLLVAHSCVNTWWRAVHGEAPPPHWGDYTRRVAEGLAAADLVVAPTDAFLSSLVEVYGRPPRTRCIWNGFDGVRPSRPARALVMAAGRVWDRAKNIEAVAEAAPRLQWPVAIAGDGGQEARVANLRRLGRLEPAAMAAALEEASIFVAPARYEPFGLGPLEAAAAGCALVLGDIPSLRELWSGAALFVPPDDNRALQGAVNSLCSDPERLQDYAGAATLRAGRYSVARMTAAYMEAYEELLDAAPLRRAV